MAKSAVKKTVRAAPTEAMVALAVQFYQDNRDANFFGRAAANKRKELFGAMIKGGVDQFSAEAKIENRKISLSVWVGQKDATYLDNETILKELGLQNFLKVCDVSKASLKKHFADDCNRLVALAERPCLAAENVHIEETKA